MTDAKITPLSNPVYDSAPDDSPAKKTVDKIFVIFDKDQSGGVPLYELNTVDEADGNSHPVGEKLRAKTLSVWDVEKAKGKTKIAPENAKKVMSQAELLKLVTGNDKAIYFTKDDAIKHLSTNEDDRKKLEAFFAGKVKPTEPEKNESEKPAKKAGGRTQPVFDPEVPLEF